jgi:hypothetical protein
VGGVGWKRDRTGGLFKECIGAMGIATNGCMDRVTPIATKLSRERAASCSSSSSRQAPARFLSEQDQKRGSSLRRCPRIQPQFRTESRAFCTFSYFPPAAASCAQRQSLVLFAHRSSISESRVDSSVRPSRRIPRKMGCGSSAPESSQERKDIQLKAFRHTIDGYRVKPDEASLGVC